MNLEAFMMKNLRDRQCHFEEYKKQLQQLSDKETILEKEISKFCNLLKKFNDFPATLHNIQRQLDDNKRNIKEKSMLLVKAQLPSHSSNTEQDDLEHQRNCLKRLIDERKSKEKLVNERKFKMPVNKMKYLLNKNEQNEFTM